MEMNKNDIDWKEFAENMLLHNIVYHKNEYSWYVLILDDCKLYSKGQIVSDDIFAMSTLAPHLIGNNKKLSWKELALELGLFEQILIPDGHDCKVCPENKQCRAYFKFDPEQERCNRWKEEYNKLKPT